MPVDWYTGLVEQVAEDAERFRHEESHPGGIWDTIRKSVDIVEYRPEQNPNVILSELADGGESYFVLKNTVENTYMRLSPTEHQLWMQMNGEISVQELIVEHFMSTGSFGHNLIVHLVEQLSQNHMLTDAPVAVWNLVGQSIQKKSWLHRISTPARLLLSQRLAIKGLDKYIEWMYRFGGWLFFTRIVQVLLLVISVTGLFAFIQIVNNPSYVFLGNNFVAEIAMMWLVMIFPVVIHELGHALTVKHYGREVPQGGIMLYFGMPAAFVETTDIWLEPRKARLAVTWNGPYTGLILGGAAALWMYLSPTSPLNPILFKLSGIAFATVFININPLLKFDGYYLLSDALNIPLLREKSLAFIRKKLIHKLVNQKKLTRNERIFTIFGFLSVGWTAYALYLVTSIWEARIQNSLNVILEERYPILSRLFSLILLAALVSLAFLMLLSLVRVGQILVAKFVRSGGFERHNRMAVLGVGLALSMSIGLSYAFPSVHPYLSITAGLLASILAIIQLINFNKPYRGSPRGWAHFAFSLALFFGSFSLVSQMLGDFAFPGEWLNWASLLSIVSGGIFLIWRPVSRLGFGSLLLGFLVGITWLVFLVQYAGNPLDDPNTVLLVALAIAGTWSIRSVNGSARTAAVLLIFLGGTICGLASIITLPLINLWLVGVLMVTAGVLHIVHASIPALSTILLDEITSRIQKTIGQSVAILVRRIIAQVYFETGWNGVKMFGREFSKVMKDAGVDLSITTNQFNDQELSKRTAIELTEIYGLAFDELFRLICRELGKENGTITFGYGIDLLPWQSREILSELILCRRPWSLSLNQDRMDILETRRNLVKRVPVFSACNDEEINEMTVAFNSERFAAGEVIMRLGDPGDKFYIIEQGKISVFQTNAEGEEEKVDEKSSGQYFGELALISDAPRNATVQAETPLSVLSLNRDDFDLHMKQHMGAVQHVKSRFRYSWLLRCMPIFDELESEDLDKLATQLKSETFKSDEIVIREGDTGDKFYIVESGQLVVSYNMEGKTVEVARRGTGEYVGEIALLENRPRTATVTAVEDTSLLSLEAEHFQKLISKFMNMHRTLQLTGSRRQTFIRMPDTHRV
jgi:putative peptide zinc metalloprotease protein